MNKFSILDGIAGIKPEDLNNVKVVYLDIDSLIDNPENFYGTEGEQLEELKASIKDNGVLQPLLVVKDTANSLKYKIIAGHRRKRCCKELGYSTVPCIVLSLPDEDEEIKVLIETNATARTLTSYERVLQVVKLQDIFKRNKRYGDNKGSVAELIASTIEVSNATVYRLASIYNNLIPEFMELFKQDKLSMRNAIKLAQKTKEEQLAIYNEEDVKETTSKRAPLHKMIPYLNDCLGKDRDYLIGDMDKQTYEDLIDNLKALLNKLEG